jgi:hypothetical protein
LDVDILTVSYLDVGKRTVHPKSVRKKVAWAG